MRRAALLLCAALAASSCTSVPWLAGCQGTTVTAEFEQIGDLVENANVQSSDVVIGRTSDIRLDGWVAEVDLCINPKEEIPSDARAVLRTTSLLGEKFVDLKTDGADAPPLSQGDVISLDQTSKATELEDVFVRLGSILGGGNLEQLNRFTSAQADILRDHAGELRTVLRELHTFTDVLANRKSEVVGAVDNLDRLARTLLEDRSVLTRFLDTFADSSDVLAGQSGELQNLLTSLDRFTNISVQLLAQTEQGLNRQFEDLRPVLRTVVSNSNELRRTLRTLATFLEWWPETMPGDYLQLDVCQAAPEDYSQGFDCANRDGWDEQPLVPSRRTRSRAPNSALELILHRSLGGESR